MRGRGRRGTKSANISVNSARYKSIGATVMPPPRSRSCQKFSSPRAANYCPIPLRETSVSRTLADGLYFSARASPRCNLYLITAGNILDLKSFLVKYRNIKETSSALPQGERASERAVEGNDLPFMNSLRLPGRLENPRSCSHLSPLFLFHSSPFVRPLPSPLPSFLPFDPPRSRSLSVVRELSIVVHDFDIPLIFLSRSYFLTISFYSVWPIN